MEKIKKGKNNVKYIIITAIFICAILPQIINAQQISSLYTKDGSVFKGEIIQDGFGNYIIFSKYGEFNIDAKDIITITYSDDKATSSVMETFILDNSMNEAICIIQKDFPVLSDSNEVYTLMIPGHAECIYDINNYSVPFNINSFGSYSRITIKSSDILSKKIFITTKINSLLGQDDGGNYIFKNNYLFDADTHFKLIIKYPKEWKASQIRPAGFSKYEGLIIWDIKLKRQKNFIPLIKFSSEK